MLKNFKRKHLQKEIHSDDFEFLNDSGLKALVAIVGIDANDQNQMGILHRIWTKHITSLENALNGYIRKQPYYQQYLEAVQIEALEEINKDRPDAYTRREIIEKFVDTLSYEYRNARERANQELSGWRSGRRIYPSESETEKWAIKYLLKKHNERRKISKADFKRNFDESKVRMECSATWQRLYQKMVIPHRQTMREFSLANTLNHIGEIIPVADVDLGSSPLDIREFPTFSNEKAEKKYWKKYRGQEYVSAIALYRLKRKMERSLRACIVSRYKTLRYSERPDGSKIAKPLGGASVEKMFLDAMTKVIFAIPI